MYRPIQHCRLCGSERLEIILELGEQALTGVFATPGDPPVSKGPLTLVLCRQCGLLQLRESYDLSNLYGAQ
jgi:ribosomal protein L40E